MKTQVDIKLLNGSKQEVTYENVETVGMPLADGTGEQVFTAGEPLDDVPVVLDFSEGNQTVEAPEGYVVRSAVIAKPEGAEQVIAKGETLAGIPGEYVTPGTTKEIEPDFSQKIVETDVLPQTTYSDFALNSDYGVYAVDTEVPYTLTVGETYMVVWDGETFECVCQDASALNDGGVALGNCTNWGLLGNGEPFAIATVNQGAAITGSLTDTEAGGSHTVRIYQSKETGDMVVTPSEEDERWNEVVVKKPEGLVPENISEGIEVAGVLGTNQGVRYGQLRRVVTATRAAMNISSYNYNYNSCALTIMVPSTAEIVSVGFSKTMSYGSSLSLTSPDWRAGQLTYSSFLSGSFLVFTTSFSYTPSRSQEKHALAGGVEFLEPLVPLYVDTLRDAALGCLHFPTISAYTTAGYGWGDGIGTTSPITAYSVESYPVSVPSLCFDGVSVVTVKNGDVPARAFYYASGPETVLFSKASIVGAYAFYECKVLEEVAIPECEAIGSHAFAYAPIKTVSFPKCKTIASNAFAQCSSLTSYYFLGQSVPTLEHSNAFSYAAVSGTSPTGKIFVRASLLSAFEAATNWSYYSAALTGLTDEQIAELEG